MEIQSLIAICLVYKLNLLRRQIISFLLATELKDER